MTPADFLDRKFSNDKPRKCWMCACVLTRGSATVGHLVPKSRGGADAADNFRLACKPCNGARGNQPISRAERDRLKGRAKPARRDYSALAAAIRASRHP